MSFLNTDPFDNNRSFKESEPTDTVLGLDGLEKAGHVGVRVEERLGAAPFAGEALDDPVGDVFGGVDRLESFAKGGHKQRPNKKDSRFLAGPYMASVLVLSTARAVRDRLFSPLNELRAHCCAEARSVFRHPPAAA